MLRYFQREGIEQGTINGDSMLVVKQLNGAWRAKAGAYLSYYKEAVELRRRLPGIGLGLDQQREQYRIGRIE